MSLKEKYQSLINVANQGGVTKLSVQEKDNVLYVGATAPSEKVKQQIWDEYNRIDPDMRAGDLVLDIDVAEGGAVYYTVQEGDSLSKIAQSYPRVTWQEIFEANRDQIKDPNLIHPGQKLRIPRK